MEVTICCLLLHFRLRRRRVVRRQPTTCWRLPWRITEHWAKTRRNRTSPILEQPEAPLKRPMKIAWYGLLSNSVSQRPLPVISSPVTTISILCLRSARTWNVIHYLGLAGISPLAPSARLGLRNAWSARKPFSLGQLCGTEWVVLDTVFKFY